VILSAFQRSHFDLRTLSQSISSRRNLLHPTRLPVKNGLLPNSIVTVNCLAIVLLSHLVVAKAAVLQPLWVAVLQPPLHQPQYAFLYIDTVIPDERSLEPTNGHNLDERSIYPMNGPRASTLNGDEYLYTPPSTD
jgi:hypothetical protein